MKKAIAFAATLCLFQFLAWLSIRHDIETLIIPPDAVLPDNSVYYGELIDGRFHGKGKLLWSDGSRYEGEFRQGLMSGRGELHTSWGDVYAGEFREGVMTGQGEWRMKDGSVYSGAFLNNLPHGYGELKSTEGYTYRGEFAQREFHGKGIYISPEGEEYEGDFAGGEFTGNGAYRDKEGNRYEGAFRDWKFHGEGAYTTADGDVHRGHFEDGLLDGKGVYEGKDGERYEGDFKDGRYHGTGVLTRPNGDRYSGGFEYGLPHGKGEAVYAEPVDGHDRLSGEWEYGEFQDPQAGEKEALLREQMERALFRQDALLEETAGKVAAGTPGEIDLYFVGLAGYGQQDVFMKELHYIRELMDARFGASGRSALLVNHAETLEQVPLATRSALERTLRAVAQKMNAEEDVLFLYLTSHGTGDHTLSISHPAVKLPSLSAAELATMLKSLPVKWKIVAVSACYAGGFIPALRDEYTLVMTAASAERRSFGCSDTSEMTWFARAYFKESLPRAASFEEAFESARKLIGEWELGEIEKGGEHSEPQIAVGKAIAAHLKKWWQLRQLPKEISPNE
jgi:hypothetical protein